VDLLTWTPERCTTSGKFAMASWSLFLHLGPGEVRSVPGAKVSSILPAPDASLVADMYNNLSNPVIFCSMI